MPHILQKIFGLSTLNLVGQAVNFAAIIPLAIVYGPASFAAFSIFAVATLLIARLATFRMEEIIRVEADKGRAANTAIALAIVPSALLCLFDIAMGVCVLAMAIGNVLIMVLTDRQRYQSIGIGNIIRLCGIAGLQLAFYQSSDGLILGYTAGHCLSALALLLLAKFRIGRPSMGVVHRHWRFSILRLPAVILTFLSTLLPLSIINDRHSPAEAGGYALADRLVGGAATIITLSIEYVLFGELDRRGAHRAIPLVLIGICAFTLLLPAVAWATQALWIGLVPPEWEGAETILIILSASFASWVGFSVLTRLAIILDATRLSLVATIAVLAARTLPLLAGFPLPHALSVVVVSQIAIAILYGFMLNSTGKRTA